jgi:Domain of unknown function (DUF4157)
MAEATYAQRSPSAAHVDRRPAWSGNIELNGRHLGHRSGGTVTRPGPKLRPSQVPARPPGLEAGDGVSSRGNGAPRVSGSAAFIRPKLRDGQPGEASEQEADEIADWVMRSPAAGDVSDSPGGTSCCVGCASGAGCGGKVQRQSASSPAVAGSAAVGPRELSADIESRIRGGSAGQPLPGPTRSFFESRFGRDLGDVQVHAGPEAAQLSDDMQAYAFTYGAHVWLGSGVGLEPSRVLAHELAHVVQQAGSAALGSGMSAMNAPSGAGQAGARRTSAGSQLRHVVQPGRSGAVSNRPAIQRKEEPKKEETGCNITDAGAFISSEISRRFADPEDPRVVKRASCLKEACRMLDADQAARFAQHIIMRRPGVLYSGYEALATPTRIAIAEILGDILKRKDTETYLARLLSAQSVYPPDDVPGKLPEITTARVENNMVHISLERPVQAVAVGVSLLGPSECDKFTFGFTQFETESSAVTEFYDSKRQEYKVIDYSGPPKKPCQDVHEDGDIWSFYEKLECSSAGAIKSFGQDHYLSFHDKPRQPIVAVFPDTPELTLTGVSWFDKFVTVFSVVLPNGVVHHISWFDWQIDYCENNPRMGQYAGPTTNPVINLTGQQVQVSSIHSGAPPSPVADQIGKPAGKSCNTIDRSVKADFFYISSPLIKCRSG